MQRLVDCSIDTSLVLWRQSLGKEVDVLDGLSIESFWIRWYGTLLVSLNLMTNRLGLGIIGRIDKVDADYDLSISVAMQEHDRSDVPHIECDVDLCICVAGVPSGIDGNHQTGFLLACDVGTAHSEKIFTARLAVGNGLFFGHGD